MTLKIAHIVNFVNADPSSDLVIAQPVTVASMKLARASVTGNIDVQFYSAQYSEDHCVVDTSFIKTPDLERSIQDIGTFKVTRKLPLLFDILSCLDDASNADYFIYTNVDIALMPNFYQEVALIIEQGFDAFSITRRDISDRFTSPDQMEEMFLDQGMKHGGYDCFVFPKAMFKDFIFNKSCLGTGYVGAAILVNMAARAKKLRVFRNTHLTFHIGSEVRHANPALLEYRDHNQREYFKLVKAIRKSGGAKSATAFFRSDKVIQPRIKVPFYSMPRRWLHKRWKKLKRITRDKWQRLFLW